MNTKFLKQSFVLLLISIIFAASAIRYISLQKKRTYGGEFVFAQTTQNLNNLGRLTIEREGKAINLQLEDNLWRVMEMGNYYAGYNQINNLFKNFAEARIYRRKEKQTNEDMNKYGLNKNALHIITRDNQEQILNDIYIGKKTTNNLYHFAKISTEDDIFLITGKFNLSKQPYSWLQQPILTFSPNKIRRLSIGQTTAVRSHPLTSFFIKGTTKRAGVERYINTLIYVSAYDVRRAADFDDKVWPKQNHIQLTTFEGLVTDINIYGDDKEYWVSIKISATNLPKASVNDYIKNNAFLYDGWFFKLDDVTGETLLNAFIVH